MANLVIVCVIVWLPLSAAISIRMHLLAHAASLPAWMQLLHPVATVIANSKLLKKHVWVQVTFRCLHRMAELDSMRKTAHRYQQTKQAFAQKRRLGCMDGVHQPTFRTLMPTNCVK